MALRPRLAIVGAGVAGLALSASLDPTRFEVVLYEAQPERVSGAALGLWASSRRALMRLGVVLPGARADSRVQVHRLDGRPVVGFRTPAVAQVRRPALMAALQAAVPKGVQRTELAVVDSAELEADLVIGADGVRSAVRGLVCPPRAERLATPWVTLRGIRGSEPDGELVGWEAAPGVAREFWGAGLLFGDAPVAGGRYWFTAHRSDVGPEPLDPTQVLGEARGRFADAAPVVRATLEAHSDLGGAGEGEAAGLLATRLWTTPALPRYRRGRYVVIGDAAHASLPNLGRGASDAILDAVSLARVLNRNGSLAAWEARRLAATQAARSGAALGMRFATAPFWGA